MEWRTQKKSNIYLLALICVSILFLSLMAGACSQNSQQAFTLTKIGDRGGMVVFVLNSSDRNQINDMDLANSVKLDSKNHIHNGWVDGWLFDDKESANNFLSIYDNGVQNSTGDMFKPIVRHLLVHYQYDVNTGTDKADFYTYHEADNNYSTKTLSLYTPVTPTNPEVVYEVNQV